MQESAESVAAAQSIQLMAFEIGWHVDQAGGLESIEIDELNSHLRSSLHTKDGDYRVPLATGVAHQR
jgi:hypothetical protein